MSEDKPGRAHYDELEFDDQLALLEGEPFTGIIYDDHDNGSRASELNYADGLPSGLQRRWYPDGTLKAESEAIRGQGSSWSRKWHPNGTMSYERIDDDMRPVRIREWSDDGEIIVDMDENHPELAVWRSYKS